jgi:hypothetical protein
VPFFYDFGGKIGKAKLCYSLAFASLLAKKKIGFLHFPALQIVK